MRSPRTGSALAVLVAGLTATTALAQDAVTRERDRCATRLSIAVLGQSPSSTLLGELDPKTQIPMMLESTAFINRFSRFVNAEMNDEPGMMPAEDAAFYMAREVLTRKLPWKEMFLGKWRVETDSNNTTRVVADPDGLGFFRSPAWLVRYAGNEEDGYKLSTAYRIMNNVIGLQLVPATNAPDVDISSTGRMAQGCRGCHYDGPFALDKVARVLTKRVGEGEDMTFAPSTEAPQEILGGQIIQDDRQLVEALVNSEDFRFNTCRLVFKYLYGRNEYTCEGPVFDRCMDAFAAAGTVQAAIAAVAGDASFCQ